MIVSVTKSRNHSVYVFASVTIMLWDAVGVFATVTIMLRAATVSLPLLQSCCGTPQCLCLRYNHAVGRHSVFATVTIMLRDAVGVFTPVHMPQASKYGIGHNSNIFCLKVSKLSYP